MKNLTAYICGFMMAVFSVLPPVDYTVTAPGEYWPWMVLLSGFLGFYLLFFKNISVWIKLVAVGGFLNCYLSAAPFYAFTAYFSLVCACYFYVLCKQIRDFTPAFKILQASLLLHAFVFVMQSLGMDPLLNFSEKVCYGITGQHMQSASFSVILTAALLPYRIINLGFPAMVAFSCRSFGGLLSVVVGFLVYLRTVWTRRGTVGLAVILFAGFYVALWGSGKLAENAGPSNGRLVVWFKTMGLALDRPWMGWGVGTYKILFPALCGIDSIPWKNAHNCWLQILFETGFLGFSVVAGWSSHIVLKLVKALRRTATRDQAKRCLCAFGLIASNMIWHFPTRMLQTALIIIFFLAYCERVGSDASK